MALLVRVKPRAERQIDAAAAWWSENRLAAPGAIRSDLKAALEVLVEQPGIGYDRIWKTFLDHPVEVVRLRDAMNPRLRARIERDATYV